MFKKLLVVLTASTFAASAFAQAPKDATPPATAPSKSTEAKPAGKAGATASEKGAKKEARQAKREARKAKKEAKTKKDAS
jgi:hypothetical protein